MTVKIEGTDFVISNTATPGVVAFIAVSDKAEALIWRKTKGNHIRTAFGFTLYTQSADEAKSMTEAIVNAKLSYWHAGV